METCCEIILDLENDLSRMKEVSESLPEQLEYAVGQCKVALDRMRKLVVSEGFPDRMSEIYFFSNMTFFKKDQTGGSQQSIEKSNYVC